MKKLIGFILLLFSVIAYADIEVQNHNIDTFKQLFSNAAEKLNADKFDDYYAQNSIIESNGKQYKYSDYKKIHQKIYANLKSLQVIRYNDIFAAKDKVVGRMDLRLTETNDKTTDIKVFVIAQLKNNKIEHLWQITYPSI